MRILVYGVVQGVGFRPTVYNIVREMGLRGYIRNNGANVEIVIDGGHEDFLERLRNGLPPLARLEKVEIEPSDDVDFSEFTTFRILLSSTGSRASVIPADTAMCDNCYDELVSDIDRRHLYPFINCTDCGARYSLISDLPYDRPKTSMAPFDMCDECNAEYTYPGNRRFHAQTTSCPACGPAYTLHDGNGKIIERDQVACFRGFAARLDRGEVGVMKSWGGMHICSDLGGVGRLRALYQRPQKPFAVMMRDLDAVRRIAVPTEEEEELLSSRFRPIVLCRKKGGVGETDLIAPGLDTMGIMLPYSPAHHLFFRYFPGDGIVATSANPPGEPICRDNGKALSLGLDCHLLHDRDIVQRVDDSVVRLCNGKNFFIRKSRSFVPDPLPALHCASVLSVGAEENVTTAVSRSGKIFNSQYIGKTRHYDTLQFLVDATDHMLSLMGMEELDLVVRDMHPGYATRRAADRYAERFGCPILDVQHHWAHAASLSLEHGIEDRAVALSLDGSGYGPDGTVWGGEILEYDLHEYRRVGRLGHMPLLGGEKAIYEPMRLVFAMAELAGVEPCERYYGGAETEILRKMVRGSILTSSTGRLLDAVSAHLGICRKRTYDGEPAMKLEGLLYEGRSNYEFDVPITGRECSVVETVPSFRELLDMGDPRDWDRRKKCDVASSFVGSIVGRMTTIAAEHAMNNGISYVGVTGGVSYNVPIIRMIEEKMRAFPDLELLLHDSVPNGDGGIAIGQNAIGGRMVQLEIFPRSCPGKKDYRE